MTSLQVPSRPPIKYQQPLTATGVLGATLGAPPISLAAETVAALNIEPTGFPSSSSAAATVAHTSVITTVPTGSLLATVMGLFTPETAFGYLNFFEG